MGLNQILVLVLALATLACSFPAQLPEGAKVLETVGEVVAEPLEAAGVETLETAESASPHHHHHGWGGGGWGGHGGGWGGHGGGWGGHGGGGWGGGGWGGGGWGGGGWGGGGWGR